MSMPSEELQLLIAGYVLGDLSPDEAAEFEQLVAENPAIATEIAQMQAALDTAYAPTEVAPPAHLRAAILDQAQNLDPTQATRATPRPITPLRPQHRPWRRILDGVAAALILTLGINNYRLWRQVQATSAQIPSEGTLTYVLDATRADSQASATVLVNPASLRATITVENLPPLPPGKVYALWTVLQPDAPFTTDDKAAILTEVFHVDASGQFSQTIAVPTAYQSVEWVTKVAVTIEDAGAPQRHTGQPILITGL